MSRDDDVNRPRLSRLSTAWDLVRDAHSEESSVAARSKLALIERYENAILGYLRGATRDQDRADELFQEFAVRVLRGSFSAVSPTKGRFRDYLRKTLINLVHEDHRRQKRHREVELELEPIAPASNPDQEFDLLWRQEVLRRVWMSLEEFQLQSGNPAFTILRLKVDHPTLKSDALATRINQQLETDYTPANCRKLIQRARDKFAGLLLEEVGRSLESPDLARIEEEIVELGLLEYCRTTLEKRRKRSN